MRKFITHLAALVIGVVAALSVVGGVSMYDNLPFRLTGADPGRPSDLQAFMFVKVDHGPFALEAPPGRADLLSTAPVQQALAYSMERTGLSKLPPHFRVRFALTTDSRIAGYARVINLPGQDPLIFVDSKWHLEERISILQHEFVHLLAASRYGHLYSGLDEAYAEWASTDPLPKSSDIVINCQELNVANFSPVVTGPASGRVFGKLLFTVEERRGGPNAAHLLFDQLTSRSFNDLTWRTYLLDRWGCPPLPNIITTISTPHTVPAGLYLDSVPQIIPGD